MRAVCEVSQAPVTRVAKDASDLTSVVTVIDYEPWCRFVSLMLTANLTAVVLLSKHGVVVCCRHAVVTFQVGISLISFKRLRITYTVLPNSLVVAILAPVLLTVVVLLTVIIQVKFLCFLTYCTCLQWMQAQVLPICAPASNGQFNFN
jgi:hypothetical protein